MAVKISDQFMNNVYFRIRDIICSLRGDFVFYVVILFVMLSTKTHEFRCIIKCIRDVYIKYFLVHNNFENIVSYLTSVGKFLLRLSELEGVVS